MRRLGFYRSKPYYCVHKIKQHYENILDRLPLYIYWKTSDGRYLGANSKVHRLLAEYKISDISGLNHEDLTSKSEFMRFFNEGDHKVREGMPVLNQIVLVSLEGRTRQISINKYPIYQSEHNVSGIIGVGIDISQIRNLQIKAFEQKRISNYLQKINAKLSAFHKLDVREKTADIYQLAAQKIKYNDGFSNVSLTDPMKDYLHELVNISDLDISGSRIKLKQVNLMEVVKRIYSLILPVSKAKEITLLMEYFPDAPQEIISDELHITFLLLNLLTQSLFHCVKGHMKLAVSTINQEGIRCLDVLIEFKAPYRVSNEIYQSAYQIVERLTGRMTLMKNNHQVIIQLILPLYD